jgi:hypothetical protein
VLGLFLHLQYLLRTCSRVQYVDTFVSLSIALFMGMVLTELAMCMLSHRGSIVETHGG